MLTIQTKDLPIKDGDIVLDIGCGEGRHTIGFAIDQYFSKNKNIVFLGHDLCFNDLSTAKSRLDDTLTLVKGIAAPAFFSSADLYALPHKNASIDHIICSEVLEHLPNYKQAITEMNRVLKPGGTLAISVPRRWTERICWKLAKEYANAPGGHVHIFNSKELQSHIEGQKFSFIKRYGMHALHMPYWWLRCLFWSKGDNFFITKFYHKLLIWDLFNRPFITSAFDKICNPWLGKSVAMIFKKKSRNLDND